MARTHETYRLPRTVVPDDERERLVERDLLLIVRTKGPNALYRQHVDCAHRDCSSSDLAPGRVLLVRQLKIRITGPARPPPLVSAPRFLPVFTDPTCD